MDALVDVTGLGLDSFLACLLVGALGLSNHRALALAIAFGGCDAAASWIGALWPLHLPAFLPAAALALCVPMLAVTVRGKHVLLFGLPLLLSLDNLCTALPARMVLPAGAASGAMALLGLHLARKARSLVPTELRSER